MNPTTPTTTRVIERTVPVLQRHPVATTIVIAVLLLAGLYAAFRIYVGIREGFENRKVEKLEQKGNEAVERSTEKQNDADAAARDRQTEDAVRERTIKPEIQRTSRNLEEARARTRKAQYDYDQARHPQPDLGHDTDTRALHGNNCSDLRELYPGEAIPFCEP